MMRRLPIELLLLIGLTSSAARGADEIFSPPSLDRYEVSAREFERALAADKSHDVEAARRGYLAALAEDVEFVEAMVNLARVELEIGNTLAARTWIDRARVREPDYPAAHALAGLLSLRVGDLARAIDELRTARTLAPRDTRVLTNLGAALIARGQLTEARTVLDDAVRLDPGCAEAVFNLALADDGLGDSASAAHYYREFLKLAEQDTPSSSGVRERLAALAEASGVGSSREVGSGLVSSSPFRRD